MIKISGINLTSFEIFLIFLLCISPCTVKAYEILYSEDFQTGVISEDWRFYGDPISNIVTDKGNPPPAFNNNGDAMYTSGLILNKTFPINNGIGLKVDNYFYCHPRGTWVALDIGFFNPNLIQPISTDFPPPLHY